MGTGCSGAAELVLAEPIVCSQIAIHLVNGFLNTFLVGRDRHLDFQRVEPVPLRTYRTWPIARCVNNIPACTPNIRELPKLFDVF
jgi:hypothetical protein